MGGEARKESNKTKVFYGLLKEPEINIRFEEDEDEKEGDESSKPKVMMVYQKQKTATVFQMPDYCMAPYDCRNLCTTDLPFRSHA